MHPKSKALIDTVLFFACLGGFFGVVALSAALETPIPMGIGLVVLVIYLVTHHDEIMARSGK